MKENLPNLTPLVSGVLRRLAGRSHKRGLQSAHKIFAIGERAAITLPDPHFNSAGVPLKIAAGNFSRVMGGVPTSKIA